MSDFFEKISNPKELKKIPVASLPLVAEELRNKIIPVSVQGLRGEVVRGEVMQGGI